VGPRLILNALGYRQESLTPTENRVTDTLVFCSQPDHHIDLFIFNIYPVTWYDSSVLTSLVFRREIASFGCLRLNIFFRSFVLFVSVPPWIVFAYFFSFIHFSAFCSFALSLPENCFLQYLYISFVRPLVTSSLNQTSYTQIKTLLGLGQTASNTLKCNCVLKPKHSPNFQDCRRKFSAC